MRAQSRVEPLGASRKGARDGYARAPALGPTLAFLALACFITTLVAIAQDAAAFVVRDSAKPCLNLRPEPNTDSNPLDCLPPGTRVAEVDSIPYWRRVRLVDGREGWVAKKFIEPASASPLADAPSVIPQDAWLEVHFVDVGQGDGIWIHTHDDGIEGNGVFEGRNIAIDGGPDARDDKNAMLAYLSERAPHGSIVDALIVTHPHDDHFPGADGILRHYQVSSYYDPGYPKTGVAYPKFIEAVRSETVEGTPTKIMIGKDSFETPNWGRELTAEILYAYPGSPEGLGSKKNTIENNASIVLRLAYGSHTFLFMGDAEGKDRQNLPNIARFVEKILLETVPPEKLKATVLKVGHHGSETSSTLPFIEAVDPEVVVVCSGRKSFGGTFIPDASTLRRYCCHDSRTRIYRTDQNDDAQGRTTADDADGDHIVIRSNGTTLEVRAFESGRPFEVTKCEPACDD